MKTIVLREKRIKNRGTVACFPCRHTGTDRSRSDYKADRMSKRLFFFRIFFVPCVCTIATREVYTLREYRLTVHENFPMKKEKDTENAMRTIHRIRFMALVT